jgi:glyoxylase-like metal-dependent hydrolase (beta-lactamase superfamily II)
LRSPVISMAEIEEPVIGSGIGSPIAPGPSWLRMPLAPPLGAINIWVIEDGDAWTVVDTGLRNPGTLEGWQRAAPARSRIVPSDG